VWGRDKSQKQSPRQDTETDKRDKRQRQRPDEGVGAVYEIAGEHSEVSLEEFRDRIQSRSVRGLEAHSIELL